MTKEKLPVKREKKPALAPSIIPGDVPLKNERWETFARSYSQIPNATQAAKDAGYSVKTAYSQGPRLLKNVEIVARVTYLRHTRHKSLKIDKDRVLYELYNISTSTMRPIIETGLEWQHLQELPDNVMSQIKRISETQHGISIEFYDKLVAIRTLSDLMKWEGGDEALRRKVMESYKEYRERVLTMKETVIKMIDNQPPTDQIDGELGQDTD